MSSEDVRTNAIHHWIKSQPAESMATYFQDELSDPDISTAMVWNPKFSKYFIESHPQCCFGEPSKQEKYQAPRVATIGLDKFFGLKDGKWPTPYLCWSSKKSVQLTVVSPGHT